MRLSIWYAYSANETLSLESKFNDLMTSNMPLKITNSYLGAAGSSVFLEHIIIVSSISLSNNYSLCP